MTSSRIFLAALAAIFFLPSCSDPNSRNYTEWHWTATYDSNTKTIVTRSSVGNSASLMLSSDSMYFVTPQASIDYTGFEPIGGFFRVHDGSPTGKLIDFDEAPDAFSEYDNLLLSTSDSIVIGKPGTHHPQAGTAYYFTR